MATISAEQKSQIITLIQKKQLSHEDIAARVGVSPATVSAIKAHITMGTYTGTSASETETDELIEATKATFGLERDLQLALRSNLQQLEPGLQIIDGGKERATDAGRIDITATDTQEAVVVIELKAGTAAPEALTQLLAYMEAVKKDCKPVRGILIAGDFHPRVVFAARAVPNVQLRRFISNLSDFSIPQFERVWVWLSARYPMKVTRSKGVTDISDNRIANLGRRLKSRLGGTWFP